MKIRTLYLCSFLVLILIAPRSNPVKAQETSILVKNKTAFVQNMKLYSEIETGILSNWYRSKVDSVKASWIGKNGILVPKPFMAVSESHSLIYYWDSYFTNKGLLQVDSLSIFARNITDNLLWLVDTLGFVPNSNMSWGMNRSQPPFLAQMVNNVYEKYNDKTWLFAAYQTLKKEYHFWTDTSKNAIEDHSTSVSGLQRYFHHASERQIYDLLHHVYERGVLKTNPDSIPVDSAIIIGGHFLSEAATGMDFCSRFGQRCADYIPVCLNSNLFQLEMLMGKFVNILNLKNEPDWKGLAEKRKKLMNTYLWNDERGAFMDYDFKNKCFSPVMSAASFYPLTVGLASRKQAARTVNILRLLETEYGIASTEKTNQNSHFQWDFPSGWPPLFSQTIDALHNYGYKKDAIRIATKYLNLVAKNYLEPKPSVFTGGKGKSQKRTPANVYEKYDVSNGEIYDAEYASRAFFGWSTGVYVYALNYIRQQNKASYIVK